MIGRPYPLFRRLFRDAAESGSLRYGAAEFVLQSLGNIAIMAALFLAIAAFAGGQLQSRLAGSPARLAVFAAPTLIVADVFTLLYRDVRLLARREIIPWYPIACVPQPGGFRLSLGYGGVDRRAHPHARPRLRSEGAFTSSSARNWATSVKREVWHFEATLPPRCGRCFRRARSRSVSRTGRQPWPVR